MPLVTSVQVCPLMVATCWRVQPPDAGQETVTEFGALRRMRRSADETTPEASSAYNTFVLPTVSVN